MRLTEVTEGEKHTKAFRELLVKLTKLTSGKFREQGMTQHKYRHVAPKNILVDFDTGLIEVTPIKNGARVSFHLRLAPGEHETAPVKTVEAAKKLMGAIAKQGYDTEWERDGGSHRYPETGFNVQYMVRLV